MGKTYDLMITPVDGPNGELCWRPDIHAGQGRSLSPYPFSHPRWAYYALYWYLHKEFRPGDTIHVGNQVFSDREQAFELLYALLRSTTDGEF